MEDIGYSDSKTDLMLRCYHCVKFQLFEYAQDFLVDRRLYVVCYYPTTPTEYPSSTGDTSVGLSVVVIIDFVDIPDFLALGMSEIHGYNTPLKTFLVNNW